MKETNGGAGFVICDSGLNIIATGGCYLIDSTVSQAELIVAWTGIQCACRLLRYDPLIIKGDSTIIIFWIKGAVDPTYAYPMIHDIAL